MADQRDERLKRAYAVAMTQPPPYGAPPQPGYPPQPQGHPQQPPGYLQQPQQPQPQQPQPGYGQYGAGFGGPALPPPPPSKPRTVGLVVGLITTFALIGFVVLVLVISKST